MRDVADAPTDSAPVPAAPPEGKGAPFGLEPWMLAGALGFGAGVAVGLRLSRLLSPPPVPGRVPPPCAECERRRRIVQVHEQPPPAPVAPPVGESVVPTLVDSQTAVNGAAREFSAQSVTDDA